MADIDTYRNFIFPNNIRQLRKQSHAGSLLQLSQKIPSLTYIRLSKIERGTVFARADELRLIARALDVAPVDLLVDIDDASFDIADWAADFLDQENFDRAADTMAVLLAAAVRARRASDDKLTIAALENDYGIAPVILSRIENAHKSLDRWNDDVLAAIFRLFGVRNLDALHAHLISLRGRGELDAMLPLVANPDQRIAKTRAKVLILRLEVTSRKSPARPRAKVKSPQPARLPLEPHDPVPVPDTDVMEAIHPSDMATVRLLPVFGTPLPDGLIGKTATGEQVEAPGIAGPRAYGLRVCRPSLGPCLPARAILVVDPDRFPFSGGLAVIREVAGLRLLYVTFDRQGRMMGYSEHPEREIVIDDLPPADVATILSARFE